MSNAPDRYEKFVVPEGVAKISYEKDEKLPNSGTFIIQREDHTVGNLVRMQLLKDDSVIFAGYKIPHPLEHQMLIKLRTTGAKSPALAIQHALEKLEEEVHGLSNQFKAEAGRVGYHRH